MKGKKLYILAAIFLLLLVIFILDRLLENPVAKKQNLVDIDTSKVDCIYVKSPTNAEVTLKLVNGTWRVTEPLDAPADARSVHEVLKKLTEMNIESVVSNRPEQQHTYEVDSAGVLIEVKSQNKILSKFIMGKMASTYRHTYFRKPASRDILMVKGSYKFYFNKKVSDWRNKVIMELNKDAIESVSLAYPKEKILLSKVDTTWTADNGKEKVTATLRAVDPLLNYLIRLRATDFLDLKEGITPPDFSQSDCVIEVNLAGGNIISLSLLKEDEEGRRYYVKKSDDANIYIIYQGTASVLMKKMEDFKRKDTDEGPPPPMPPGKSIKRPAKPSGPVKPMNE